MGKNAKSSIGAVQEPQNPQLGEFSQNFLGLPVCIGCISLVPTKLVDFLCKLLQTKVKQVVQGEEKKNIRILTK